MKILESFLAILREGSGFFKSRKPKPPIPSPSEESFGHPGGVPLAASATKGSLSCPYCLSQKFVRRGWRQKKLERVQLYLCLTCHKTFTLQITKGKHYPLNIMLDTISLYNLGYSLEESCRIINEKQKTTLASGPLTGRHTDVVVPAPSDNTLPHKNNLVKTQFMKGVDLGGVASPANKSPHEPSTNSSEKANGKIWREPEYSSESTFAKASADRPARPTPNSLYTIQPSTLSNWLKETEELCKFKRMREYAVKKYSPADMIITATLAHRQLYRYRFHQAKCELMIQEQFQHRKFTALKEFLEMVLGECPHQYFQEGLRASEVPLTFSKKQMIVRSKQNYATKLCEFVLQSVKERRQRHEALQKFMLYNDSVTVATEVPVYLTKDDLLHLKTQLGFEIYNSYKNYKSYNNVEKKKDEVAAEAVDLPRLITGHIDFLQIRNGQIHILDYKPEAAKVQPIDQLTLYAMALSRLTGLRLFEFKCAWFDENDFFEFYPLHVLHKPRKGQRRRKVYTMEGIYEINKSEKKVESIRPKT